jgi:hypothetical protein
MMHSPGQLRPGSCFLLRRHSRRTQSASRGRQTNLQAVSNREESYIFHRPRCQQGLTCDIADEFHVLGGRKHSCPVVLAAGCRGPILAVSCSSTRGPSGPRGRRKKHTLRPIRPAPRKWPGCLPSRRCRHRRHRPSRHWQDQSVTTHSGVPQRAHGGYKLCERTAGGSGEQIETH